MSIITRQDTNGVKPLLQVGEFGYDNYPAGGDVGRVYIGTGSENIPLAKKAEMLAVDVHFARVDNPHGVTKAQVGLGNVENLAPADMPISSAVQAALNAIADKTDADLLGVPKAPTAAVGTNSTQLATTAFVGAEIADKAYSKTQLDAGQLDNRYYTETELDNGALDTRYFTETELLNGALDVRYYTETEIDTLFGNLSGNSGGNSGTATKLATARTIGGVSFDGTANIDLPGVNADGNQNTTGNAGSATKLATARTINGVAFDGTANIVAPTNLDIAAGTTAGPIVTSSTGTGATLPTASDTASGVVTTGAQTIAGVKTFTSSPIVPTPTTNTQAANKAYVDSTSGALVVNDTRVKAALNASGAAPIYACRAWVNFNGNGTVAIRASGNVSSITDSGSGSYTANIITPLPLANISATTMSSASYNGNFSAARNTNADILSINTTTIKIATVINNSDRIDHVGICISVFG